MSFGLGRTFKKIGQGLTGLLGAGGRSAQPGPPNPFGPPDVNALLSNENLFGQGGQFDFLGQGGNINTALLGFDTGTNTALSGGAANFSDLFQAPESRLDPLFEQLLGGIGAPSSIEEVQRQIEEGQLQDVLGQIEREGEQAEARTRGELEERGLVGPGQVSDIEANALAQLKAGTGRTKAGARTSIAQAQIERLRDRERAERDAFGRKFELGAGRDAQLLDLFGRGALQDVGVGAQRDIAQAGFEEGGLNRALQLALAQADIGESGLQRGLQRDLSQAGILQERDLSKAGILADLFTGGAQREISGRRERDPGILENILRNTRINIGKST